jgi:PAS domain S-box-containing protein
MSTLFFDKLLSRIDKVDPARLHTHMARLRREWRKQETILQSIQEGVVVLDERLCLADANRAAEKLLSFKAESFRGKSMESFFEGLDFSSLATPPSGGRSHSWSRIITHELEITYPERRILSVYAVPLEDEDDAPSVLVILRDVTAERDREASALEGERQSAVKQLAAGVAHEIGNPLNALNIHLQLLGREMASIEDEEERASLTQLVDVAKNEVSRLDGIIRQFLSALRPSKPDLRPCDIVKLVGETLGVMRVEIENRRISVAVSSGGSTPMVLADPDQMKQVFFNLVKNALEAMADGGRLDIGVTSDDSFLRIDFRDNGKGIPEDELGRIFEAYHTTKERGTGLGLMIVQRIVRDHGGQIDVSSREGEGTCFRVRLPLASRRVRKIEARVADSR